MIHRRETDCGHCWAEANGQPDPKPRGQWTVVLCDECDELWPCPAVRAVARLAGVLVDDIDAAEVTDDGAVNVRMKPKPELIEINIPASSE